MSVDLSWLQASITGKTDPDKGDLLTALSGLDTAAEATVTALAGKANVDHNHEIEAIVDLADSLADRVTRDGGEANNVLLKGVVQYNIGGSAFASGKLTLDFTNGSVFDHLLTANVTSIVIENFPAAIGATYFKLRLQQDATGSRTVAWPANWLAVGGTITAPSSTANSYSLYEVWTYDGGETFAVERQVVGIAGVAGATLNGDLAYGGLFYGNAFGGAGAVGNKVCRWNGSNFEIPAATIPIFKTGTVTHIRQNNRTNQNPATVGDYGNGGNVAWIELRKALSDGKPDMTTGGLLGRTADYDPATVGGSHFSDANLHPKQALQSSISVTAGVDICMVWRTSTQDSSKYASANFLINDKPITPRAGPAWPTSKVWYSFNNGSSWVEAKAGSTYVESTRGMYQFWGELFYNDGIVHGNPYRFSNASAAEHVPLIDGQSAYVRQKFKMRASVDFVAKAVDLRLFAESDNPKLSFLLFQGATLLEAVTISPSLITKMPSADSAVAKVLGSPRGNPNAGTKAAIQWFRVPFSVSRTLVANTQYEAHIRAGTLWVWNGTAWLSTNNGAAVAFKGYKSTTGNLPASGNTTGDAWLVDGSDTKGRVTGVLNGKREGTYEALECFEGAAGVSQGEYTINDGGAWTKVAAVQGTGFSYDLPVLFVAA